MTQLTIRQSGGANIVSIPKTVLTLLDLHVGSTFNLSVVEGKIILEPVIEDVSLEALLAGSPKERLVTTKEDDAWLNAKPVGKEIE